MTEVKFKPLIKNNHFQTIYTALFHKPVYLDSTESVRLKISENVQIEFDYNRYYLESKTKTCVILVHGLESSSKSNYISSTAKKLLENKIDVIRVNMRNANNTHHLSDSFYHAGLTDDINKLMQYCIRELGYKYIFLVGFSLGANIVLKLAGELKDKYPEELKGVCAVSPPFELSECSKEIVKLKNKIYNSYYLKKLLKTYVMKKTYFPEIINENLLKEVKNLYDFDNIIVASHFGYKGAEDYYRQNSSLYFLKDIMIRTLVIQAKDDPIIPFSSTLKAQSLENPHISYLITENGGHVGFLNSRSSSEGDPDIHWAENRIVEFASFYNSFGE